MGENVDTIGSSAFYSCPLLSNITIPNSVTSIGAQTFRSCSGLASVFIGGGVESIGNLAFDSCRSLKCIYFYGEISPTISSDAFTGVPAASVITLETYPKEMFEPFNVSRGTTFYSCLPMPTLAAHEYAI